MEAANIKPPLQYRRRGVILVLAALCLIVVIAFLAFSVDWGYMVVTESELQNAADAGALAGARALANGRAAAISAAQAWVGKNVAGGQPATLASSDVDIGLWDNNAATFTVLAANAPQNPNAIRVTCRRSAANGNALPLFFAKLLGTQSADLSATATARSLVCGLIIGLTGVSMSGSSNIDSYDSTIGAYSKSAAGNKGTVCSNGDIVMSGSTGINGDGHPGSGRIVKSSSSIGVLGTISPLSYSLSFPAVNPGSAVTTNDNGSIPLSDNGKNPLNSKNEFSLSGGDGIDLAPGTYYFSKLTLSGSSSIRLSGATTIFVTGNVDLSGGTVLNGTCIPKNLQLYPMGSTCTISGSSDFYGLVYGPTTAMTRSGSSGFFGAMIGESLSLSGSGGIHADSSLDSMFSTAGRSLLTQ